MEWPILQRWFCSVRRPCINAAMHWSHPSHRAETGLLVTVKFYCASTCKVILKLSFVTERLQCPWCKPTISHRFIDILSRYDLFWWLLLEKIAFCSQHSRTKYRYFIWAKQSIARRAVMVHSARSIAPLLALFDVALTSLREKPSWIDWTIEIFPLTHWGLLGRFPARRLRFRVSHRATCCVRWSLTSYRPVVHTCSHFGARVRRRHMPRETARAPPQVPQHFDGARANRSLFAPPVALISFKSHGTD